MNHITYRVCMPFNVCCDVLCLWEIEKKTLFEKGRVSFQIKLNRQFNNIRPSGFHEKYYFRGKLKFP